MWGCTATCDPRPPKSQSKSSPGNVTRPLPSFPSRPPTRSRNWSGWRTLCPVFRSWADVVISRPPLGMTLTVGVPEGDRLTGRLERLVEDGPRTGRQDQSGASECSCVSLDPELSGDQTAITSTRSSSPVKSSPLRVYRSRPLACAVAAISRSANRLRGFRPSRTTAATTSP